MKIFIAGHKGMVGSAIFKKLSNRTDIKTYTIEKNKLDLLDQTRVFEYFCYHNFDNFSTSKIWERQLIWRFFRL